MKLIGRVLDRLVSIISCVHILFLLPSGADGAVSEMISDRLDGAVEVVGVLFGLGTHDGVHCNVAVLDH